MCVSWAGERQRAGENPQSPSPAKNTPQRHVASDVTRWLGSTPLSVCQLGDGFRWRLCRGAGVRGQEGLDGGEERVELFAADVVAGAFESDHLERRQDLLRLRGRFGA